MATRIFNGKQYRLDKHGFLMDPGSWDEDFAEGMAPVARIQGPLTEAHWRIIRFVRLEYDNMNDCPSVYVACRRNALGLGDLQKLFPAGYLRGVCRLAGFTYREAMFQHHWLEENLREHEYTYENTSYHVDANGFLVNPSEWDERFALLKARELRMPDFLTRAHWEIIRFLRSWYQQHRVVPTVYETCEYNKIHLDELEHLFPTGYHRGLVKISGLNVRCCQ